MAGSLGDEKQGAAHTPEQMPRDNSAFWFASALVGLLVSAFGFSLWAMSQPWFFYHTGIPWDESYGYSHRAYGLNCDILISGDSTALADLVPAVIEDRTKLKTCNVGEVRGILDLVGTHYTIDDYLAHNRPPRFLVTGWAPDDLDLERAPFQNKFYASDGFAYGVQYRSWSWVWKATLAHPSTALGSVLWAGTALTKDTAQWLTGTRSVQSNLDERARRDSASGMYYIMAPPQTHCIPGSLAPSTNEKNAASIAGFRRHYTTPQTQVLVYVSPVADCDN
jgi:hypothetical protein